MKRKPVSIAQQRFRDLQKKHWRIVTNQYSAAALRYAANICGYTPLVFATIDALEEIAAGRVFDCRALYQNALKTTPENEPLLYPLREALRWATSNGTGEFLMPIVNLVDPIYYARLARHQPHSDAEVYGKMAKLHDQILTPYYWRHGIKSMTRQAKRKKVMPQTTPTPTQSTTIDQRNERA